MRSAWPEAPPAQALPVSIQYRPASGLRRLLSVPLKYLGERGPVGSLKRKRFFLIVHSDALIGLLSSALRPSSVPCAVDDWYVFAAVN